MSGSVVMIPAAVQLPVLIRVVHDHGIKSSFASTLSTVAVPTKAFELSSCTSGVHG